ncbi:MAG: DEAD/DEAH box helicase, partial [Spirochaetaceae bacterium]|nr:DEAD/DEAH box helicase [Spirochaetaceae bacterium]
LTSGALRVLYVSPLKALGTDIRENLTGPLRELKAAFESADGPHGTTDIRIGIRNGDTTPSERRRQINRPPEFLVTTPESLNILLLSDGGRALLSTVEICILDEIHAIASSRRGTLLVCALERLVDLAGEVQRIGLTATVRPVERAAAFLGGYRPPADSNPADPGS